MTQALTELDARGLNCPLPLLRAKQALNAMDKGQRLKVFATDAGSVRDFKAFTDLSEHQLISSEEHDGVYIYVIEKH